jgi:actin related protein 2/3 complex subunit 4
VQFGPLARHVLVRTHIAIDDVQLQIERQNRPEAEDRGSKELLLPPITVTRSENECVFIEPSINSCRISVRVKQADELEGLLAHMLVRFLSQRAEQFIILRRKPIEGYDISFLITHSHLEKMQKHQLIAFVLHFLSTVDSELSGMKLAVNSRARVVARAYMEALAKQ